MATVQWLQSRDQSKTMVAAIDFGTTFSGYAFAFRHEIEKDNMTIHGNNWDSGQYISEKAPTCILFNERQELEAFGYDAEKRYADLVVDEQHENWYFFKRYKMFLYSNMDLRENTILEDENGKQMTAMKVISTTIQYLKDHLLANLGTSKFNEIIDEDDIYWVLTVPAIWSDKAKQFMRKAAESIGIKRDHLDLSLEPEAGSIYSKCFTVTKQRLAGGETTLGFISPDIKYMVLDAGGGTVDITIQQMQDDGKIHQVYHANGGNWGGTKIDEAFEEKLRRLVGTQVLRRFKREHLGSFSELFSDFEIKKRTLKPNSQGKITFRIPSSLNEVYQQHKGESLKDSITKSKSNMTWIGDKLRMDATTACEMFTETCQNIVSHMEQIFCEVENVQYILMIGGFSQSEMLQYAVKQKFSDKYVINPAESGMAVVKGAVLFGFDTQIINVRVMKETYGIQTCEPFDENKDPISTKQNIDGTIYCNDKFSCHVKAKEAVPIMTPTKELTYFPIKASQTTIDFKLFSTDKENPIYCENDNCNYIYTMTVDVPNGKTTADKEVKVNLFFGGTEIVMHAVVVKTGRETQSSIQL